MSTRPANSVNDPTIRTQALYSVLVEKEDISTDYIEEIVNTYQDDIGPKNGAHVVAKAWTEPEYRKWLMDDASSAIKELGYIGIEGVDLRVFENTPEEHNVIVCTLCSCYAWPLLGLPPAWYKAPAYRSKMVKHPRQTLRKQFGLDLDPEIEIKVWDTSAEIRYMVIPQRPSGTEDMSQEELAELVTRDSMIGVERLA